MTTMIMIWYRNLHKGHIIAFVYVVVNVIPHVVMVYSMTIVGVDHVL
jgi:hypothetical protein